MKIWNIVRKNWRHLNRFWPTYLLLPLDYFARKFYCTRGWSRSALAHSQICGTPYPILSFLGSFYAISPKRLWSRVGYPAHGFRLGSFQIDSLRVHIKVKPSVGKAPLSDYIARIKTFHILYISGPKLKRMGRRR